jgi:hypothetical protein
MSYIISRHNTVNLKRGGRIPIVLESSLLLFICSAGTISNASIYAQEGEGKIAVTFEQVYVRETHDWRGCANWDLTGQVAKPPPPLEGITTVILDRCVDQHQRYPTIPTTAIVDEIPSGEERVLRSFGLDDDWQGWFGSPDALGQIYLDVTNPPPGRTPMTIGSSASAYAWGEYSDYNLSFHLYNCKSFPPSNDVKFICNYPPGQYYRFDQGVWIGGDPPDPDLGGCVVCG